jgi:hypothetical protein
MAGMSMSAELGRNVSRRPTTPSYRRVESVTLHFADLTQATLGGRLDTTLSVISVTLFALPGYWLGLMLVMVFTYWARALPAFGAAGFDADFLTGWSRISDRLRHLALPLVTLTLIGIGGTARFVRGAMLDVRRAPHVAVARAKGLPGTQVTLRHVLRNALIPIVTLLGLSFGSILSGTVIVENVFSLPGAGKLLVDAISGRDYPLVQSTTLVFASLLHWNVLEDNLYLPRGTQARMCELEIVGRRLWWAIGGICLRGGGTAPPCSATIRCCRPTVPAGGRWWIPESCAC